MIGIYQGYGLCIFQVVCSVGFLAFPMMTRLFLGFFICALLQRSGVEWNGVGRGGIYDNISFVF